MTSHSERRAIVSLAFIFAVRMLGLFMILPIFAIYAQQLQGSNAQLIGLALGIYGLTQGLLQIPFGMLSDRWGRKPIIAGGLCLFAIGSIIAAMAQTIDGVILGRALQGAGAVGSATIALLADLTQSENRTKAMAVIGMTIALSFAMAMILGPLLNNHIGVPGIFWLTAILASVAIIILYLSVPNPSPLAQPQNSSNAESVPQLIKSIITNAELLRLDIGILIQHAILTATFIAIPLTLSTSPQIHLSQQWFIYLPVLLLAFLVMIPFMIMAEKKNLTREIFVAAILCLGSAQILLWLWQDSIWGISLALLLFFAAFTLLESLLPSLVSKFAPAAGKGTALGIYSSAQFFGIFLGGILGGWLFAHHGVSGIFTGCAMIAFLWSLLAMTMNKPPAVTLMQSDP